MMESQSPPHKQKTSIKLKGEIHDKFVTLKEYESVILSLLCFVEVM